MDTNRSTPTIVADHRGFSIIELLVVVSFIAILASIALPRFGVVKSISFDAAMKSDLQSAFKAEESHFADNGAYAAFSIADGGSAVTPEISASSGVNLVGTLVGDGFRIVATHDGSDRAWCVSTESGRVVEGSAC